MNNLEQELQSLLAEVLNLPPEQITAQARMGAPEAWDSLQHLNLILSLEEYFRVRFTPQEIVDSNSLAAIQRLLQKKLQDPVLKA